MTCHVFYSGEQLRNANYLQKNPEIHPDNTKSLVQEYFRDKTEFVNSSQEGGHTTTSLQRNIMVSMSSRRNKSHLQLGFIVSLFNQLSP